MKNANQKPSGKPLADHQKAPGKAGSAPANTAKAGRPGMDQGALAEERAEGEGMIAPPSAESGTHRSPERNGSKVEGEGSYTATRRYDEGVARSVAKGDTDRLAKKAAAALDGPEGSDLRKAEEAAKHGHAR